MTTDDPGSSRAATGPDRATPPGTGPPTRVHPTVDRLAAYGWRLLVLTAVLVGLLWLIAQLWVILLAVVIAIYLSRALAPLVRWLEARRWPRPVAAFAALLLLLGGLGLIGWVIVPQVADEFGSLGPTLGEAADDLERWLVEDAPFNLDEGDLDDFRSQLGDAASNALRSSGGTLVSGATIAAEAIAGIFVGLVSTFFFLKDGPRLRAWALERVPAGRRDLASRLTTRAWGTLGGYLRGVAILGTIEGAIIAVAVALVGGELVWAVAVLTFVAAFVPIVGAIVAGIVAVAVTLATAGFGAAVVVALVALGVQQLDNDLLAPVVYGRALQLHPLAVLFAVLAGGALFGIAGTVLSVPFTAVAVNVTAEARKPTSLSSEPASSNVKEDPL